MVQTGAASGMPIGRYVLDVPAAVSTPRTSSCPFPIRGSISKASPPSEARVTRPWLVSFSKALAQFPPRAALAGCRYE